MKWMIGLFEHHVATASAGLAILLMAQAVCVGNDAPRIERVDFTEEGVWVTHQGMAAGPQFQIRANVPDVGSPSFQQALSIENGKIEPVQTTPQDAITNLVPSVSKLDTLSLDIKWDAMFTQALGKRVTVLRKASDEWAAPEGTPSTPLKMIREEVMGTLAGFKGDANIFTLQVLNEASKLVQIDHSTIVDVEFQDDTQELRELVSLLKRRSEKLPQVMIISVLDAARKCRVQYLQPAVDEHSIKVTNFLKLDSPTGGTIAPKSYATLWNDTFYDWQDVVVTFTRGDKKYDLRGVSLLAGQKGSFLIESKISVVTVQYRWLLTPTIGTEAAIAQQLDLSVTDGSDLPVPEGNWWISNSDNSPIAKDVFCEEISVQNKRKIEPTAKKATVDCSQSEKRIPKGLDGEILKFEKAQSMTFDLKRLNTKKVEVRGVGDLKVSAQGRFAAPILEIVPGLKDHLITASAEADKVKIMAIHKATNALLPANESAKALKELADAVDARTGDGAALQDKLRQLNSLQADIDALRGSLEKLTKAREDLNKMPIAIVNSAYRGSLRRERARILDDMDREIQLARNEVVRQQYALKRYLVDQDPRFEMVRLGAVLSNNAEHRASEMDLTNIQCSSINEEFVRACVNFCDYYYDTLGKIVLPDCEKEAEVLLGAIAGTSIKSLAFTGALDNNSAVAEAISRQKTLEYLDLGTTKVDATITNAIVSLPSLKSVRLEYQNLEAKDVVALSQIGELQVIKVNAQLPDSKLKEIQKAVPGVYLSK